MGLRVRDDAMPVQGPGVPEHVRMSYFESPEKVVAGRQAKDCPGERTGLLSSTTNTLPGPQVQRPGQAGIDA
jgi:hypothetical protein